jgi:hypothetical protein
MKVDNPEGYAIKAKVLCDSVGGALRESLSGRVYRLSENK